MFSARVNQLAQTSLKAIGVLLCAGVLAGCQANSAPNLSRSGLTSAASFTQARNIAANPFADQLPVVARWNDLLLAAIRNGNSVPTVSSHQLFMLSAAMFDAYAMYTTDSKPFAISDSLRRPVEEHTEKNQQAAVSQAAYQMLIYLFPNYEIANGPFLGYLVSQGLAPTAAVGELPEGIGYASTLATIVARDGDGSFIERNYLAPPDDILSVTYVAKNAGDPESIIGIEGRNFDPNRWQPLRVANGRSVDEFTNPRIDGDDSTSFRTQRFQTSHWLNVKPFALTSNSQFRAEPPPSHGSQENYTDALGSVSTNHEAYLKQVDDVVEFGAKLNEQQKALIEYWSYGPRSESLPGHWNRIAQGVVERDGLTLGESTQLFFALNAALLDAGIAAWDTKRWFDFIRPVSAIRRLNRNETLTGWQGPNRGNGEVSGDQWNPYQNTTIVTPPFPGYVSSHGAFGRAASEVLTLYTLRSVFYDGKTKVSHDINNDGRQDNFGEHVVKTDGLIFADGPERPIALRWASFHEAANQASLSRLYAGTQIQDGVLRGREMGRLVGRQAFCKAQELFDVDTYRKLCSEIQSEAQE